MECVLELSITQREQAIMIHICVCSPPTAFPRESSVIQQRPRIAEGVYADDIQFSVQELRARFCKNVRVTTPAYSIPM